MKSAKRKQTEAGESAINKGYDDAVKASGPGLEDHAELIGPEALADQLDETGLPIWDDSERAAPMPAVSSDGIDIAAPIANPQKEMARDELRKRARALSIPGRSKMTKQQLARAVRQAAHSPH